ncbi:glycosyltransferase family 4 protein [Mycobacterium heckeshornense]|uniref:Glycosyl transferase n=1 Tax=Mycobacterium heckeshornense TaxID=110505 RepID=A0A7R7TZ64_9MYCO|nr:glycosyltransferase family 4 protein [Mycobacterium heckeshornense]BCO37175.1 glycosyl transferase [Mycobacterium heckeshornense]BCQ10054.1 glycosyl transferase [Mycobacterium heckeshornense]
MVTLRRLRIAVVAPPYFDVPPRAYGGVEAVIADLLDALLARGHDVTLLGAAANTAARFIPVWDKTVPQLLGQPLPEVAHAGRVRDAIESLARTEGLEIVHEHTLAGPLNARTYRQYGISTLLTVHGPLDEQLNSYYRALADDLALVAVSDRQRAQAPELNWVGRVHNALRVEDWPFEAQKDDYALFMGRFNPQKAPHLALQAAHEADIPLILAGKCTEPDEKVYFSQYVQPQLAGTDLMFGQADAAAKRKLLAKARCLLFPIQWEEPFGMVMIEAMACGTPVVALDRGAVREIVNDGVTGFVCADPAELAPAIQRVASLDPQACRRHVKERFSAERMALGYERLYRQIIDAQRLPAAAGASDVRQPPGTGRWHKGNPPRRPACSATR